MSLREVRLALSKLGVSVGLSGPRVGIGGVLSSVVVWIDGPGVKLEARGSHAA